MPVDRITIFCFAASYSVALVLELMQLFGPRKVPRALGIAFGGAGLLAHTLYLVIRPLSLSSQVGSLLFLAWILAVFYLYGSIHHRRLAWGVFVLPLVLALIALGSRERQTPSSEPGWLPDVNALRGERFWGLLHGTLLLLAAVGVCVGFLASIMYLIQTNRLRAKTPPGEGVRLLSLERLEEMNRRAITLAFPLLTAGVLIGVVLIVHTGANSSLAWTDPRILSTAVLWVVFAILLYLRYGFHVRGRHVALLTIVAFCLLLFTLATSHSTIPGGGP
jgi:ABC-type transport system involved in cytochrome c biogenesis permease subunit